MRLRFAILALSLLGSCAAPAPDTGPRRPAPELAARTAGAPERCVLIQRQWALRTADNDRHLLIYGTGKTIWANDLGRQCGFGYNDILISEPVGSYYCRGDLIRSVDRYSRIPGPSCILGDFVPYNR